MKDDADRRRDLGLRIGPDQIGERALVEEVPLLERHDVPVVSFLLLGLAKALVLVALARLDLVPTFVLGPVLALVPGAEMVKFSKDGSTAVDGAIRLARAFTGRDLVACCGDHPFFSTSDWFIGTSAMPGGIPQTVRDLTLDPSDRGARFGLILPAGRTASPGAG